MIDYHFTRDTLDQSNFTQFLPNSSMAIPKLNPDSSSSSQSSHVTIDPKSPCSSSPSQQPTSTSDFDSNSEEHDSNSLVKNQNQNPNTPTLLHVSFNQDFVCFATGTDRGFRIYNCDPYCQVFRRDFNRGGGFRKVEMMYRYNIFALVGGGSNPEYPSNKVMLWDDLQNRFAGELSFRSEVRGVRLRRDRIVAVLEQKVSMYNIEDFKLLHQIETGPNPKGLCELSHLAGKLVLACPGLIKGQVRVEHYGLGKTKFITAHDSSIACFALTHDGAFLATASSKGTLIRVFDTSEGVLLQEVRRGADRAEIYSLAFSTTAQWLAVSSDKGTVHVFNLKANSGTPVNDNVTPPPESNAVGATAGSTLSFIKGVLPRYFNSKWSVAQFRLLEGKQYIVAFGHQKHTVIILGMDGSFYRCKFDPVKGGEMIQLEYHNFLKPEEPL